MNNIEELLEKYEKVEEFITLLENKIQENKEGE